MTTVGHYCHNITRYRFLSREDELELMTKYKSGDEDARLAIIKATLQLVVNIAKKYVNRGLPLEDLISEGNIGLIRSLDSYKIGKQRLLTYATFFIRGSILHAIRDKSRVVRLPRSKCAANREIHTIDIDKPIGDGNITIGDTIPDKGACVDTSGLDREHVTELVSKLGDRHRLVISMRYGLLDGSRCRFAEIAQRLGITLQAAHHSFQSAIKELRKLARGKKDSSDYCFSYNMKWLAACNDDIAVLGLLPRVEKRLRSAGLNTVSEVCSISHNKLLDIPEFGATLYKNLYECVSEYHKKRFEV